MTSPIQSIPDELLNEIFAQCLPDPWAITLSSKEAPLLLTYVCRLWRHITIESNEHWHWLKFHAKSVRVTSSSRYRPLTEALGRAKGGSLNLQIDVRPFTRSVPPIFDPLIVPFSQSLTRLTIYDAPVRQLSKLPPGLFPKLERLGLRLQLESGTMSHVFASKNGPLKAFEDAPALRHVALASGWSSGITISLPYAQLTHFMYTANEGTFHSFLMEDLPTYKKLRWLAADLRPRDVSLARSESWDTIPPRSMPNIEYLSLTFWGAGDDGIQYPNFFAITHFPNLKALRLEGNMNYEDEGTWPTELLTPFLRKLEDEFTQLEYLSICHSSISISRSTLQRTFKATSRLTTLDLHIYKDFENVFEVLTLGPDASTHLLPRMQTLILEVSLSSSLAVGEIIYPFTFHPFLESRLCSGAATRTLRKIIVCGVEDEQMADERPFIQIIQGYVSQGLLELERRNVLKRRGRKYDAAWMERDASLSDWAEVRLII